MGAKVGVSNVSVAPVAATDVSAAAQGASQDTSVATQDVHSTFLEAPVAPVATQKAHSTFLEAPVAPVAAADVSAAAQGASQDTSVATQEVHVPEYIKNKYKTIYTSADNIEKRKKHKEKREQAGIEQAERERTGQAGSALITPNGSAASSGSNRSLAHASWDHK